MLLVIVSTVSEENMSAPAIFRPPAVSAAYCAAVFGHAAISLGEEFAVQQGADRTCQHFGDRERQPEELQSEAGEYEAQRNEEHQRAHNRQQ